MTRKSNEGARLCPNCANVVDDEAVRCLYCNSDLSSDELPQWLNREDAAGPRVPLTAGRRWFAHSEKFVWPLATIIVAVIAFLGGVYAQRSRAPEVSPATAKQLQAKDQIIQSQELELGQLRQQLTENSTQLAASKTKAEESQKQLATTQERVAALNKEIDRVNATRSTASAAAVTRTTASTRRGATRAADVTNASASAPTSTPSASIPVSGSAPASTPSRRSADARAYETIRPTAVYEDPTPGARVVSQIGRGTRINVVSASGDFLEVRSRHGNPPGYVRADDARAVRAVN